MKNGTLAKLVEPSVVEQQHVEMALEAMQTAMSAIDTLLSLSSWVLTVLGVLIAIIAIFGWVVIRNAVIAQSEQIANKRMNAYLKSDAFKALLAKEVDQSVRARWQSRAVSRLEEERAQAGDVTPFKEVDDVSNPG